MTLVHDKGASLDGLQLGVKVDRSAPRDDHQTDYEVIYGCEHCSLAPSHDESAIWAHVLDIHGLCALPDDARNMYAIALPLVGADD